MLEPRRILVAVVSSAAVLLSFPFAATATIGPYTYPFYSSHTMTQDYGDTDFTGEPPGHGHAHWHNGIDWSMSIGTNIAASRAGTIGNLKENLYDGQGPDQYGQGNYVFVSHGGSRWSLYYHLTHNGVLFSSGTDVSAGEHIAESGNTGFSTGPHLHYSLMTTSTCQTNSCDTDPRLWTTNPGRVPFKASYNSEGGDNDICYGDTITRWVKFKNTGGRTWSTSNDANGNGRIVMYSTNSSGTSAQASNLEAADWETSSRVTPADQSSVGPDGIGTFTFGLKGNGPQGSYSTIYLNLRAYNLKWFNYDAIGNYSITVFIVPNQACG